MLDIKEAANNKTSQVTDKTETYHGKFKIDFTLPKFRGDPLAWTEFWELYAASVHKNPKYAPVEKFVYLRSHLEALRSDPYCVLGAYIAR